jgi:hypothetical protein
MLWYTVRFPRYQLSGSRQPRQCRLTAPLPVGYAEH